ncbi:MAG: ion transporter [Flavobacteriales bacterium]
MKFKHIFDHSEAYDARQPNHWRTVLHTVIFGTDTRAGRRFDLILLYLIIASVVVVLIDSVHEFRSAFGTYLIIAEWVFTVLFTFEYVARLLSVKRPLRYVFSFFGLVDLLAILPTFLSFMLPGAMSLTTIRILRVIRVFRILKLGAFLQEAGILTNALYASRRKITVFLTTVLALVVILGSMMYVIEGREAGFTSIPRSIYWAIVTLTTVGYGDIAPQTPLGQTLAAFIMILGYSILAVPTGIVSSEMAKADYKQQKALRNCPRCTYPSEDRNALFCSRCGAELNQSPPQP